MSASPFRWRRASRKSSIPFFPGAWPNSSAHDSIVTKSEREAVDARELSDSIIGDRVAQLGQHTSSLPSESSHSAGLKSEAVHGRLNEHSLQHIDHVTDFHRRLSLTLSNSQAGSIGSIPTEAELQMDSSRTDTFSSSSGTTIATPSPLSPATSLSFPPLQSSDVNHHHKKSFTLSRTSAQHSASSNLIQNSISARTSAQLDSPLLSFSHGLPPLSLPSHTLSFSPQSIESYFSSDDHSRKTTDTNMSPFLPPLPPSSTTPASFVITSPVHQDSASLPEIPSSSGFATSFYPVLGSHEDYTPGIHGILSPAPSGPSRGYGNDSPVLPSEEGVNPKFLSPLIGLQQRDEHSPSLAEMDAFGLATVHTLNDAQSDISIPTSLPSQFAAEPGIRDSSCEDAGDTLRPGVYGNGSPSPSLSLSLSSIGTLSLNPRFPSAIGGESDLRRNKRRSEPPLSTPTKSPSTPAATTTTSSAVGLHAISSDNKFPGLDKVKKFGGKLKRLFNFRGKAAENSTSGIGVSRSTQVTNVEYASVHPIPRAEAQRTKTDPGPSPGRAKRSRRQSLPILSMGGSSVTVSRPRPLRPASFLAMDPADVSGHGFPSSSKLADLQHAQGSKVGSRSSTYFSRSRASTGDSKQRQAGKGIHKPLPPTPVTPARERRRSEFVAPTSKPAISPRKLRRFSMSPGLTASRMDVLKPHPPLPQPSNAVYSEQSVEGGLISEMAQKQKANTSRMVKARSMVVGHVYHRKPVPILDDGDDRKNRAAECPQSEPEHSHGNAAMRPVSSWEHEGPEGVNQPSFLADPPVLHRALPVIGFDGDQKSRKRRSRGFSFTSTVSKRAQKARSMIIGRAERDAAHAENGRSPYYRSGTDETRGSSLGCADYEPDLIPDSMSFAPRPDLPSTNSAISMDNIVLKSGSSGHRIARSPSSESNVADALMAGSLLDVNDSKSVADTVENHDGPTERGRRERQNMD